MVTIFVACNVLGGEPTIVPDTPTPTPLVDARLQLSTVVPAGLPDNPLQMVMQPVSSSLYVSPEVTQEPGVGEVMLPASSTQTELDLEEAILKHTSVTVDVVPVASPAEALQALCNTTEDVSAVWVDGVAFSAALTQNCGEPIYVVRKRVEGQLESGESGVVIINRNLGSSQLSVLNSRTYCRLGVDDFYSWLLPSMVFRASNIDSSNFEAIVDYDDNQSLVEAVANGDCTGAGLSGNIYNQIVEDNEELSNNINVVVTTPRIPYAVLMYPVEMQLGIRVSLTDGLESLADDNDDSDILRLFLGQDDLQSVDLQEFADYDAFLDTVGLDFSILGD